ncbi:hypothetical protein [Rufibacter radiotolerans]|nr:hypothetical protein [Rufibacter radiotolerans]
MRFSKPSCVKVSYCLQIDSSLGMEDKTLTEHFGKRTLEVNPANDYV